MQVCTSLQTDNHASTPPLSFYRPDALPAAQPTASKHWRQIAPTVTWWKKNYIVPFYVCLIARHALSTVDEPSPTAFTLSQRQYRSFICSMSPPHSYSSLLCYISSWSSYWCHISKPFPCDCLSVLFLFAAAAVQILPVMQARPFLQDQDHSKLSSMHLETKTKTKTTGQPISGIYTSNSRPLVLFVILCLCFSLFGSSMQFY